MTSSVRGQIQNGGLGRAGAAPLLRLDRGADGRAPRVSSACWPCWWSAVCCGLRQPRAALSARGSGARQAAGGGGQQPSRCQAHRRQPDRRPDRIPKGETLYSPETLATIAEVHIAGRKAGRRRQRLVARNAAALARRKGRQPRRRDAQGICRRPAEASGAPLHLGRPGRRGGHQAACPTRIPARFCRWCEKLDHALDAVRRRIPAMRSPSPACRPSPRVTALA